MSALGARSVGSWPPRTAARVPFSRRTASKLPHLRCIPTQAGLRARWCIDIRYGVKLEAVQLMQEWVRDIGSKAGLTPANATINSGAVGVPESRLELEVEFDSFAELEEFWAAIPPAQHKAWSQQIQKLVVHGSPTWEVYRTVPLLTDADEDLPTRASAPASLTGAIAATTPSGRGTGRRRSGGVAAGTPGRVLIEPTAKEMEELSLPQAGPPSGQTVESGLSIVTGDEEAQQVLDWKGDPMTINPGDKMPFKFQ